jgi:hypothetical protein
LFPGKDGGTGGWIRGIQRLDDRTDAHDRGNRPHDKKTGREYETIKGTGE